MSKTKAIEVLMMKFLLIKNLLGHDRFCIAGGAIVSALQDEKINDVDIFILYEDDFNNAFKDFSSNGFSKIKERKSSYLMTHEEFGQIDLVFSESESFDLVISKFDLLHCAHYFHPRTGLVSEVGALDALSDKIIYLLKIEKPYSSMSRVAKFVKKGFSVNDQALLTLSKYCLKAPWGYDVEEGYL